MDYVVYSQLSAEKRVEEAEQMDETYAKDEYSRLRAAYQQSRAEGKNTVKEPFFAVVFPPGLNALGQT